ncbi:MAG: hypothetical protein IKN55_10930 [Oscillospiraceae bacterium]|nr:hypothetical protein [Oscillospiraceae bacterium]
MNNVEKMKALMEDEAFVKELLTTDSPEEVQAKLAAKDVELTIEEIEAFGRMLTDVSSGKLSEEQLRQMADGELSDSDLAEVAGGEVDGMITVGKWVLAIAIPVCIGLHIWGSNEEKGRRW